MDLAGSLAASAGIEAPVALVAAHPDDEVLGLGSRLAAIRTLTIIHLTDGAPRDGADARRAGFDHCRDYGVARRAELDGALAMLGVRATCIGYGYPDQEAIVHCGDIVERLATDLAGVGAVITHAYEHGHPDHDTAAVATRLAIGWLQGQVAAAPGLWEFAGYHLRDDQPAAGVFWPDAASPETTLALDHGQRRLKRAALACFATQAAVIGAFPLEPERIRPAPAYDFSRPAPPGAALYDRWGIAITGAEWRRLADAVLCEAVAGRAA